MLDPTEQMETTRPGEEPHSPELALGASQGLVRAAGVLAVGKGASLILGMVREMVKARFFGASPLLSAFEIAALVPTTLYDLIIGGMVNSSLVPVFSEYTRPDRRDELWDILSIFLSVTVMAVTMLVGLVELSAPIVARILGAYNLEEPGLTDLTIRLIRLSTPVLLFLSLSSVLSGVLYALRRFTLPAFTAAAFNATIVIAALIRPDHIDSLVWGMLFGSLLQVVLQLPAVRDSHLRWNLNWRHPALARILGLYAPIIAGLVVNQAGVAIGYHLATLTGDANLTYMRYATTLYQLPLGLVVTGLSIAILPTLSEQAHGQLDAFKQTLAGGLKLIFILLFPATFLLFALAPEIVALLFQYGQFTGSDTTVTALVLRVFLFGLPFAGIDQMLVFASYARQDTRRPALVGVASILIYVIVATSILPVLGLLGLMVADAIKHVVHMLLMLVVLRRQTGGLDGQQMSLSLLKTLFAALLASVTAAAVASLVLRHAAGSLFLIRVMPVAAAGAAGIIVYGGSAVLLDIPVARSLGRLLLNRGHTSP